MHAPIHETPLSYHDGDQLLQGVLVRPSGTATTPRPGVLVFHEAWGVNDYTIRRARMLAEQGYVALAADMWGERYGPEQMQTAMGRTRAFREQPLMLRARAAAAQRALATQDGVDAQRLAAIGYCFGGTTALELARSGASLRGVASFHGTLSTLAPATAATPIAAAILVCTGAADPMIPPEQIAVFQQEMTAANADFQIQIFGGAVHSFSNPAADAIGMPGVAYHAAADRRSWQALLRFLGETLA